MERLTRLNQLVRKSFKHLNRTQTKAAFVRHYFIVQAHAEECELARYVQLTNSTRLTTREEYVSIPF